MLGHELHNPLAPIKTRLQVLRLEQTVGSDGQHAIGMIDRQAKHLTRLVDDLLDVSRITRGKIHLRKERVELRTIVNQAIDTTRHLIESRRHELTLSLPAESIWLEVDPARMEQVIGNLLSNAAKYTEPCGHVWLTAERQGPEIIIRGKETGIGSLA